MMGFSIIHHALMLKSCLITKLRIYKPKSKSVFHITGKGGNEKAYGFV